MKISFHIARAVVLAAMAVGLITCEPEKPKPSIESIDPQSGPINTVVTITGNNLGATSKINFGSASSDPASRTDTKVVTAVPDGVVPGTVSVSVTTDGGPSNNLQFEILPSIPEITSLDPDKGSIGAEIAIKGKYLENATSVTFGTKQVTTFVSKTSTELKVNVPSELGIGAFDVTVTAPAGTSNSETFTVVPKPSISSFTPEVGPPGRLVQISGANLEGITTVVFGTGEQHDIDYKNPTLVEATVPASATTGKIKVITPGGEAVSVKDFTVKAAPAVTSFDPLKAVVGTVVTINGSGFEAGAVVKFGAGTATDVTIVNGAKITAKVPATATTGKISVGTAAGTGESTTDFEVIGAPKVESFSPPKGNIGATVVINGKNFINVSAVKFNNTTVAAANYTVDSDIKITAKVPAGALTGKISVTTPAGTGQSTSNFIVEVPPQVNDFNPKTGLPGSSVVITGLNFSNITSVTINDIEVGGANYTVDSPTQITAKVPANGTSGKIKVTNAVGSHTSTATFYVTPVIATINPTSASAGSPITITGTNMENAKVMFNATEVTPTSNSATTIVVNSPVSTGAKNVTVVNLGGTSNAKTFTATPPVVVDEVVAPANTTNQLILFTGSNLLGATKVWFNNTQVSVQTVTDKVVAATIPSLAVGSYQVRVETNKGTSVAKTFQVLSSQNANTSGATLTTGSSISSYSAPVAPPVQNFWLNAANPNSESFFVTELFPDKTLAVNFQNGDGNIYEGTGRYDTDQVGGVFNNYIEFTFNVKQDVNDPDNIIRYVGTWTPYIIEDDGFGNLDCMAHLTMIETKSGRQLKLKVFAFGFCD
jgi:hypothetical protein